MDTDNKLNYQTLHIMLWAFIFCQPACTRSVEKSTLKIQLPSGIIPQSKILKNSSSATNGDEIPPWNTSLNPTTIEEINCYAVFVEGPELNQNSCSFSGGSFKMNFGKESFAGFFPAGSLVTLEVPSGENRIVHLAGAVAQAAACQPGVLEAGGEPDFQNLSLPQVIAKSSSLTLTGGVTNIQLQAKLNNNRFFDTCDFVEFIDDGGDDDSPPGVPPSKPSIFLTTDRTNDTTTPLELSPGSFFDFDWLAPVIDSDNFAFGGDFLTVTNTGDYFMAWNYSVQSTGQRKTQAIDLLVDGTPVSFASVSGGYIRNSSGFDEASMNLATGISLSSSESLRLAVQETYNFATGPTLGFTNLYLEPLAATRNVFMATGDRVVSGTNINPASQSPVEWNSTRVGSAYLHNNASNPEIITITEAGRYMFSFNAPITSTAQRAAPILQVAVNSTGINAHTAANCYIRASAGDTDCLLSGSGFFTAAVADIVTFELFAGATAGVASTQPGRELSVFLEKIPDAGSFFAVTQNTASGSDWNTATATVVNWESTPHVDTAVYTHSTGSNPHLVTFNQSGDYLLQFNAPMTSTVVRGNLIVSVFVNGVEQPGSQVKSFHIRSNSGHNESSGSLFYLLEDIQVGDTVELRTQQEGAAGAITVVGEAQLSIQKKN